jgi:hypothetical protein
MARLVRRERRGSPRRKDSHLGHAMARFYPAGTCKMWAERPRRGRPLRGCRQDQIIVDSLSPILTTRRSAPIIVSWEGDKGAGAGEPVSSSSSP